MASRRVSASSGRVRDRRRFPFPVGRGQAEGAVDKEGRRAVAAQDEGVVDGVRAAQYGFLFLPIVESCFLSPAPKKKSVAATSPPLEIDRKRETMANPPS